MSGRDGGKGSRGTPRRRTDPPVRPLLLECLELVGGAGDRKTTTASGGNRRLDRLFERLARKSESQAASVQELIWSLWTDHADPAMADRMQRAMEAMGDGRRVEAHAILDAILDDAPDWAEAWNKRATLLYMQGRDVESLRDIAATLRLEPRHFGAIAGFGQIALRNGEVALAVAAFEAALAINPHLEGLGDAVEALVAALPVHGRRPN